MTFSNVLDTLFKSIKNIFLNHKLAIGISLVVFIVTGIVYYYKIVLPKVRKSYVDNREFIEKDAVSNSATLYFFTTDWCPLSKKALPEWNAFKEKVNGSYDGVNIDFLEIDCDKDVETADKFNITGYPTIKLLYNEKIYEYDAKPDRNILGKFLTDIFSNP
jgi:thiol-disulfide isomerase/thioredoxin